MSRIGRPPSDIGAMNSGAYLVRGSARLTTPSAARLASTWPVNALVIEPIRNSVSAPGASFGLSAAAAEALDRRLTVVDDAEDERRGLDRQEQDLAGEPDRFVEQGLARPRGPRPGQDRAGEESEDIASPHAFPLRNHLRAALAALHARRKLAREWRGQERGPGRGPRHCWTAAAVVVVLLGLAEACVVVAKPGSGAGRRDGPPAQSNPIPESCRQPDRRQDGSA